MFRRSSFLVGRLVALQQRRYVTADISAKSIEIVKATVPVLAENGYKITTAMYKRMFADNPKVKEVFNQTHQVEFNGQKAAQPFSLATAVHAYAANIESLENLSSVIETIAQKHVSLDIVPEQYPIVGENLLGAISEVLGDACTPEIAAAWGEAYGFLAKVFIDRENAIKDEKANQPGGWRSWRPFVVDKISSGGADIKSFYFKPKDGKALPTWNPADYVGIKVDNIKTRRNYTVSCKPNPDFIRLTMKKEPNGLMTSHFHDKIAVGDEVALSVPCGHFFKKQHMNGGCPIVLVSGGIGVTPMTSILEWLIEQKAENQIFLLEAVRDIEHEPLSESMKKYESKYLNIHRSVVYDVSSNEDLPSGIITPEAIKRNVPVQVLREARMYICGPPEWMKQIALRIPELGVPPEKVMMDFFGATDWVTFSKGV